jgi:hypothetical protein
MTLTIAPYGSWKSPITAELIARGAVRLMQVVLDEKISIGWNRAPPKAAATSSSSAAPTERSATSHQRHSTLARPCTSTAAAISPSPHGTVYFSNFKDQRLYVQKPGAAPQPITPERAFRYADAVIDSHRQRLICVREDHTVSGRDPVNTIVSVRLDGDPDGGTVLVSGNDFYASPGSAPTAHA